jgi:hypothetical protein
VDCYIFQCISLKVNSCPTEKDGQFPSARNTSHMVITSTSQRQGGTIGYSPGRTLAYSTVGYSLHVLTASVVQVIQTMRRPVHHVRCSLQEDDSDNSQGWSRYRLNSEPRFDGYYPPYGIELRASKYKRRKWTVVHIRDSGSPRSDHSEPLETQQTIRFVEQGAYG